jgi:antitoxin (DNA-binding transcriptional repressor) of toxin-antitoxin stability system
MTQRLPTAVARKDFANVLRDSAAGQRIKLTRYNKTVAVIIPKKDLTDLEDCQRLHGAGASSEQASSDKPARSRAAKAHRNSEK